MIVRRENFPKSLSLESVADKRQRFVGWLTTTHDEATRQYKEAAPNPNITDPQLKAAQSPIKTNCIAARCWVCVHGDDAQADDAHKGWARVSNCKTTGCQLHSVRPYQPAGQKVPRLSRADASFDGLHPQDHAAKALANPGNRALAVRGFCHACCGGQPGALTMREVTTCPVVVCPLWAIRPGAQAGAAAESFA